MDEADEHPRIMALERAARLRAEAELEKMNVVLAKVRAVLVEVMRSM